MAYTPTEWKTGDTIIAEKLNNLEQGVTNEQEGPKGDAGDAGAKITAITLTTDADGKVTGGTATLSDSSTAPITVTVASA